MKVFGFGIVCFISICTLAQSPEGVTPQEAGQQLVKRLGGTLKEKLSTDGPIAAIAFCSEQAQALTVETAANSGYALSRVTDRPRNVANRANESEMKLIQVVQADLAAGQIKPSYSMGEVTYLPLVTKPLCLNCHGAQLIPELEARIRELYPEDQATGYKVDQLRGLVKVAPAE